MNCDIEITIDGIEYGVDIDDEGTEHTVNIYADGIWAGFGSIRHFGIEDCPAVLPEGVYEALDEVLANAGHCHH